MSAIPQKLLPLVKQFVATACSKERSGSMVTETKKNVIFSQVYTPKELDFYAGFEKISFIKFSFTN